MQLFSSPYRWILINNQAFNKSAIKNTLNALNILVDSEVITANPISENSYTLHKIYKRGTTLPVVKDEVGFWKPESGFVSTTSKLATVRYRNNLMGTILRTCIVVTHNDSLNHLTDRR